VFVNPEDSSRYVMEMQDGAFEVDLRDERSKSRTLRRPNLLAANGEYAVRAPMPGMVVEVPVRSDQAVEQGDVIVVLESMKMQNELRAPISGTIRSISTSAGDRVEQNQELAVLFQ
jgi:biotin carboxyl carrier protein